MKMDNFHTWRKQLLKSRFFFRTCFFIPLPKILSWDPLAASRRHECNNGSSLKMTNGKELELLLKK